MPTLYLHCILIYVWRHVKIRVNSLVKSNNSHSVVWCTDINNKKVHSLKIKSALNFEFFFFSRDASLEGEKAFYDLEQVFMIIQCIRWTKSRESITCLQVKWNWFLVFRPSFSKMTRRGVYAFWYFLCTIMLLGQLELESLSIWISFENALLMLKQGGQRKLGLNDHYSRFFMLLRARKVLTIILNISLCYFNTINLGNTWEAHHNLRVRKEYNRHGNSLVYDVTEDMTKGRLWRV